MNLIFDFDGTICNSIGIAIKIANTILLAKNLTPVTKKEVKKNGIINIIKKRKFSTEKILKLTAKYKNRFKKAHSKAKPFPQIPKTLHKLSNNHKLGILTTNSRVIVETFLQKHSLDSCFDFIRSERNPFTKHKSLIAITKKSNLTKKETFYICDETRGIQAAKKAGVKSIAVTWGAESKELLSKSKPDIIVTQPKHLLNIPRRKTPDCLL